jgi:hypothetical protein
MNAYHSRVVKCVKKITLGLVIRGRVMQGRNWTSTREHALVSVGKTQSPETEDAQ